MQKIFLLIAFLIFTAALLLGPTLSLLTFTLSSHVFCITTSLPTILCHFFYISSSFFSFLFPPFQSFFVNLSFNLYLFLSHLLLYLSSLSCYTSLFSLTSYSISPPPSPAIHLSSLSPPTLSLFSIPCYSISPPPSPAVHLSSLSPPTLSLLPLINSYLFTKYKYNFLPAF